MQLKLQMTFQLNRRVSNSTFIILSPKLLEVFKAIIILKGRIENFELIEDESFFCLNVSHLPLSDLLNEREVT